LVLSNAYTNETYTRDGTLLPKNITINVKRTPVQSIKKPTLFMEGANIWSDVTKAKVVKKKRKPAAPIQRSACPPEYLCPLCSEVYDNPCIAICCGRSACFSCFEVHPGKLCPLCGKPFDASSTVPNPKLADSVASLNMDYFVLPGGKMPQSVKPPEVVDLDPEEKPPKVELPKEEQGPPNTAVGMTEPGLPPPELVAQNWSGDLWLPVPPCSPSVPCSPSPFPWSPPPSPLPPGSPGGAMQPCMLSAEQFLIWQQSLQDSSYSDSYSSDDRRRKRKKERKKKDKKEKKKRHKKRMAGDAPGLPLGVSSAVGQAQESHRKVKKRKERDH